MKKTILSLTVLFSLFLFFAPLSPAEAGLIPCGTSATGGHPEKCRLCHIVVGISDLIVFIRNIMVYIALAVITAMGVLYIVSAGNEGLMTMAKSGLKAALVGIAIVLLAFVVINTLIFGVLQAQDNLGVNVNFKGTNGFQFSCENVTVSSPSLAPSASLGTLPGAPSAPPVTPAASVSAGGSIPIPPGGSLSLPSGGMVTLPPSGSVVPPSGGTVTFPSGGTVMLPSGGVVASPLGDTFAIPSGGSFSVPTGGSVTTNNGGSIVLSSGGSVSAPSGSSIAAPSGKLVVFPEGGSYTASHGGGSVGGGSIGGGSGNNGSNSPSVSGGFPEPEPSGCNGVNSSDLRGYLTGGGKVCGMNPGGAVCPSQCPSGFPWKSEWMGYINAAIDSSEVFSGLSINERKKLSGVAKGIIVRASMCGKTMQVNFGGGAQCGLMHTVAGTMGKSCEQLKNSNIGIIAGVFRLGQAYQQAEDTISAQGYSTVSLYELTAVIYNQGSTVDSVPSGNCRSDGGWKLIPRFACPINPGSATFNACSLRDYACDIGACANL